MAGQEEASRRALRPLLGLLSSAPSVGAPSPIGGSMREDARPRWGPWGPEGTGRSEARGLPAGWGSVQVQAQQAAGHQICDLRGPVPAGPWPRRRQRSQVQLMGLDVLELLPKLQKGGPRGGVQVPAVLHHLIDCGRAAIRSIHLIALFHPRDDVLQGL